MVKVSLDFPYCMELQDFLTLLDKNQAKIDGWVAVGPGGGNPCVTLEFPSREQAMGHLNLHYPDDSQEFLASLIRE